MACITCSNFGRRAGRADEERCPAGQILLSVVAERALGLIVLPLTVRGLAGDQASAGPGQGAIGVAFAAGGPEGACLTVPGSGG